MKIFHIYTRAITPTHNMRHTPSPIRISRINRRPPAEEPVVGSLDGRAATRDFLAPISLSLSFAHRLSFTIRFIFNTHAVGFKETTTTRSRFGAFTETRAPLFSYCTQRRKERDVSITRTPIEIAHLRAGARRAQIPINQLIALFQRQNCLSLWRRYCALENIDRYQVARFLLSDNLA